ncbi:MAG: hypothetical protein IPM55_01700 [Acidobacteria bacterium]|nr:hypothetical protein [Acidobacteriota bacterium]
MKPTRLGKLLLALLWLALGSPAHTDKIDLESDQNIRKLLAEMRDPLVNKAELSKLFQIGDKQINDLVSALEDSDRQISLRAQIVIRYLGSEAGMSELIEWYGKQQQFSMSGPIPSPLRKWDYKVIKMNYLNQPAGSWVSVERYIYALAIDGSSEASVTLAQIAEMVRVMDEGAVAKRAVQLVKTANAGAALGSNKDLANLVLKNAFFILTEDRKNASAQLLAFSHTRDKALVEVRVNRGSFSEEWYHVVMRKQGSEWYFLSITPLAIS